MLEQYYRINEAAGVSIHTENDGSVSVSACSIAVTKDRLTIEKKVPNLYGIDGLKDEFAPKTFVSLNLAGKGILYKQVEKTEEINATNFNKVLPNGNIADFYVQNFISGPYSFVAVIRKTEADKWIGQLHNMGFLPLMLTLGPFPVFNVIPQLNLYDTTLAIAGYTINRNDNGEWLSWRFDPSTAAQFPIKIESEAIHESLVIPYAAAFGLVLAGKIDAVQADADTLEEAFKSALQERKLKVQGFLILAVFFILLLVNFCLFSWLNSSNVRLTEQVSRSAQSTDDIQKINEEVQQKEGLLKVLGWEGNINKSALVDQIASLLPPEMSWKEVAVDPVNLADSRQQKQIVFYTRKIRVMGTSEKIIPVNEWIARIKTRAWVRNVQLDSYTFNSELNTGQFSIVIDY